MPTGFSFSSFKKNIILPCWLEASPKWLLCCLAQCQGYNHTHTHTHNVHMGVCVWVRGSLLCSRTSMQEPPSLFWKKFFCLNSFFPHYSSEFSGEKFGKGKKLMDNFFFRFAQFLVNSFNFLIFFRVSSKRFGTKKRETGGGGREFGWPCRPSNIFPFHYVTMVERRKDHCLLFGRSTEKPKSPSKNEDTHTHN
jgi:hypothetical protein